ncbi:MAG: IS1595 family transposase [Treponema sp.]|nr:IS1595 family transposase [Treponema sp.]
MNYREFEQLFPTEEKAIDYYLENRYKGIITCPHCGNKENIYRYKNRTKVFQCYSCKNSFSPFHDTIFWHARIKIRYWFYVIIMFLNNRSGISARNVQRQIGVSYPTALRMLRQIRKAMSNEEEKVFSGIVEVDETYIGGKPRKFNNKEGKPLIKKQLNKQGRGTNKTPAVGVKDRETGQIYVKVMLPNKEGKKLTGKQLIKVINAVCVEGTTVITDEFKGYNNLTKNGYIHYKVNHSLGQYSAGNGIHTNGIENFWSIFKMGWYGTYRHMSIKYLQLYINEFCFRQNTRLHERAFDILLDRTVIS